MNIREIAKKATSFSELCADRDLISNEDIEKYFPNGITIVDAEEVTVDNSRYYVYIFNEEKRKFAGSGTILTKIFDQIMEQCDGDVEQFHKEMSQGLKVKLTADKTKQGRPIFKVEVV